MDPLTIGLLAGVGGGLLKSQFVDLPRENRQRKLAAATQRYSPWTHLQAQPIQEADPLGSALGYGMAGAQMGQGIQNENANNQLRQAQINWLNRGGSPAPLWGAGGNVDSTLNNSIFSQDQYPYGGQKPAPWRL